MREDFPTGDDFDVICHRAEDEVGPMPFAPRDGADEIAEPFSFDTDPVDLWAQFEPPELPRDVLPREIEEYALVQGEVMGADPAGFAIGALAVCGAAISDRIKVRVKEHDANWEESARLWVVLVADPAGKKSPIISAVTRPARRIDTELYRDWQRQRTEFEKLTKEEQKAADVPRQKRLCLEDTTVESAQEVLKDSPDGVLCIQDELSGWIGSMDKYSGILDSGRRDLEMSLRRFVADETNYGVVEMDNRTRRTTTLGTRPGTMAGEATRYVMQFKGFPLAFTQRVGGRALYGHRADAGLGERGAHIGTLIAGLTMAGYVSMTMKDIVKGYWPPRDPSDPRTILAALQQGGGLGLYGDFLFGQVNRFGDNPLASALGPTAAAAGDLADVVLKLRDATIGKMTGEDTKAPLAEAFNLVVSNTPYANLFYAKPVLDFLALNSLREAISPGYTRRQEANRERDYGQGTVPFLGDRRAF